MLGLEIVNRGLHFLLYAAACTSTVCRAVYDSQRATAKQTGKEGTQEENSANKQFIQNGKSGSNLEGCCSFRSNDLLIIFRGFFDGHLWSRLRSGFRGQIGKVNARYARYLTVASVSSSCWVQTRTTTASINASSYGM